MMLKYLFLSVLPIFLSTAANASGDEAEQIATDLVEGFHETLQIVMKESDGQGREKLLAPAVGLFFDVERISRISLGRVWRRLDDGKQSSFRESLTELITVTYADRFGAFNGQAFRLDKAEIIKKGVVVKTTILKNGVELARLNYYFREDKVFNVVANGISDLSLRRAEYGSVIKEKGFDVLLAQIRQKIKETRDSY